MSRYDPLWDHIRSAAPSELTFDEIGKICGFPMDHSFLNFKKELEKYGYRGGRISLKNRTVQFHPWKQS